MALTLLNLSFVRFNICEKKFDVLRNQRTPHIVDWALCNIVILNEKSMENVSKIPCRHHRIGLLLHPI